MSFNPDINFKPYNALKPFRFWCQKVLPLVYDDSLSYYELLCKVVDYLNQTMEDVDNLNDNFQTLYNTYLQLQEYVNTYFENLDVQEEINNKLDEMATDGTLAAIILPVVRASLPPYVVDSTDDMTDPLKLYILQSNSHLYQYTDGTFVDTGIIFGGEIGNVVTYDGQAQTGSDANNFPVQSILAKDVNQNILHSPSTEAGYFETFGVETAAVLQRFTSVTAKQYTRFRYPGQAWGDWVSSDDNILNILDELNPFHYIGNITATSYTDLHDLPAMTMCLVPSGANIANKPPMIGSYGFTAKVLGSEAFKILIAESWSSGYTCYQYLEGSTWTDWRTDNNIQFIGTFNANNISDANLAPANTILLSDGSITVDHMPTVNTAYVVTIGMNASARVQYCFRYASEHLYKRNTIAPFSSNNYTSWTQLLPVTGGKNPNPKMLSVGNSILTGAVWQNGSFVENCSYNNAPYGIIANAMGIEQTNVNHTLLSDTGLVYKPNVSGRNFLEQIKATDISDFDVILTHIWIADMRTTPLGSDASYAGDGTIAGAVLDLVNYISNNNSKAQLILVSAPPVSYEHSGLTVFSDLYANGKSIHDLDVLMNHLSAQIPGKFRYISWDSMNLSYVYQDYTDGNNVHANNQNVYRIMGAYLGGRAAFWCHF